MNLSLLTLTSYSWFHHGTTHTLVQWFGIKLQFIHFKDSVIISELYFYASRIHSTVSGSLKDDVTIIFAFYRNFRSAEIVIFLFLYSSVIYLFGNLYYSPAEFKTPATGTFVPSLYRQSYISHSLCTNYRVCGQISLKFPYLVVHDICPHPLLPLALCSHA